MKCGNAILNHHGMSGMTESFEHSEWSFFGQGSETGSPTHGFDEKWGIFHFANWCRNRSENSSSRAPVQSSAGVFRSREGG